MKASKRSMKYRKEGKQDNVQYRHKGYEPDCQPCPDCDGNGEYTTFVNILKYPEHIIWITCPACQGTGRKP